MLLGDRDPDVITNLPPLIKVQSVRPESPEAHLLLLAWGWTLFISPALLMLAMSAAHGLWPSFPAAGYTTCFLLLLGYRALFVRPANAGWGR